MTDEVETYLENLRSSLQLENVAPKILEEMRDKKDKLDKILDKCDFIKGCDDFSDRIYLTGSYSRNTLIRNVEGYDFDILVIVDEAKNCTYSPEYLLQKIRKEIENNGQFKNVKRSRPCVTVEWSKFNLEIAPAYYLEEVSSYDASFSKCGFLIPYPMKESKIDQWLISFPFTLGSLITQTNAEYNQELVPIIKLLKRAKNNGNHEKIKTYEFENLVLKMIKRLKQQSTRKYRIRLFDFFKSVNSFFQEEECNQFFLPDSLPDFLGKNGRNYYPYLLPELEHILNYVDSKILSIENKNNIKLHLLTDRPISIEALKKDRDLFLDSVPNFVLRSNITPLCAPTRFNIKWEGTTLDRLAQTRPEIKKFASWINSCYTILNHDIENESNWRKIFGNIT